MRTALPTASVIIPAYNAAKSLPLCLQAVLKQTVRRESYEVIVVDDGSLDRTAGVAREHAVTVLSQPNRGAAAARNLGARLATGEILLFTDADCVPQPDWVERMLAPFTDKGIDGAKGVYKTRQRELVSRFVQLEYEERYERMSGRRYIDFVDTYSAAYRREVFLRSGGFDERFPGATVEDQELSFRLASLGCRLVFVPSAVVGHQHVTSWGQYFRRKRRIGYWKVLVHRLHPDKLIADDHTPLSLKLQVLLIALAPVAGVSAVFTPLAGWCALVGMAAFAATCLPLLTRSLGRDTAVTPVVLPLVIVRAIALTMGLASGVVSALTGRDARGSHASSAQERPGPVTVR